MDEVALLNAPPDVSRAFKDPVNTFFHLSHIVSFDACSGEGSMMWRRRGLKTRMSFEQMSLPYEETEAWEFPDQYGRDRTLPFDVSFPSAGVLRLRLSTGAVLPDRKEPSPILNPLTELPWCPETKDGFVTYKSTEGSLRISLDPLRIQLFGKDGKMLTELHLFDNQKGLLNDKPMPTGFVRRADTLRHQTAVTLTLAPGDAIVGFGESFTRFDKRGQQLNLFSCDPKGVTGPDMYKPVPFFISEAGFGALVHTSCPITADVGHDYDGGLTLYMDDALCDMFFFLGTPRQILAEYAALCGPSPMVPLWTFGMWMSRCTYKTREEVLDVAEKLREYKVPCDVIHLDTGWFETDWQCDFNFSPSRFPEAEAMLKELKDMNFKVSLWQLPYFLPSNKLYGEILRDGLAVRDPDGTLPTEDAVLDFSSERCRSWYVKKMQELFAAGVASIKADFGEAAPFTGIYASGKTGRVEHNLYPLRYQKTLFEAMEAVGHEGFIWARAGWAGCQRYPLHWGGDCESTDVGMAASLRGGLGLGISGFTFWSHDIGGFFKQSSEELYLRWLAFGAFSSHMRCHGQVPKEPWTLSEKGMELYREIVNTRYRLIPYIYTQSVISAQQGLPVLRALCIDYPDEPVWNIDDQYLLGEDMLAAPLFRSGENARRVYLPKGNWVDYQSGRLYAGGQWHTIEAGQLPIIVLVRAGSVIPHAEQAQCTEEIRWDALKLIPYKGEEQSAWGKLCIPGGTVETVTK